MAVADDVKVGSGTKIYHPELVNLYGCRMGGQCVIGAFVEIQKGVIIGNKVKIQAFAFIPRGVTIEDEVFIGPHACFTNDLLPRATNTDGSLQDSEDWELVPTKVCRKVSIGANATILPGVTIGEGAIVGAGSVVVKDVAPWTIVAGNPARFLRKIQEK